ncbi:hypothetical protein QCA50_017506 [Cerrena zonata]|uniref:PH domain-containing protein n=1 Tax=Cerrena zonata TaxID=2478898 RepID=A0AAW0FQB0_9APHY
MATSTPPKVNLLIPQTPSRDRSLQTPSQFSSPTVLRATTSSSAMSPHPGSSSASYTVPITVDSLLSTHATASNPPLAALDAAVTDRNTLAAQNTQLWKLIEKQRTAYGQIMKEMDRVRGERDLYRSRLHSMGENTEALLKAHKEKERRDGKEGSLRSATSHSHLRAGDVPSTSSHDPRSQIVRTHSDEVASRHRHLKESHSRDTIATSPSVGRVRQGSLTSLNVPSSHSSAYLTPSHTSSNSNLSTTSASTSPLTTSPAHAFPPDSNPRKPSPLQLATPVRSESLPIPAMTSAVTPSASLLNSSLLPLNTGDPFTNGTPTSRSTVQPLRTPQSIYTPSTPAPLTSIHIEPPPNSLPASASSPQPPRSENTLQPQSQAPQSAVEPSTQEFNILPIRPHALSRESRISLPEEAKRYYASIGESPAPSPRLAQGFSTPPNNQSSTSLVKPNHGFSESPPPITVQDSNGAVREVEHADTQSTRTNGRRSTEDNGEFLEMDDGDSVYGSTVGSDRVPSSHTGDSPDLDDDLDDAGDAHVSRAKGKVRAAAVEDFPLPPSTPPVINPAGGELTTAQMQALAAVQRAQGQPEANGSGLTTTGTSQPPGTPLSPFTASLNDAHPTFRALPLLASDLPRTQVNVSHSSIRANDRGKEVLSFTVIIDPGSGKRSWKIEKLFSDVLTLDARVRATLGKNSAKKLQTIPEGKLWRDHAPAKVDQRKVALELYFKSLIALPVKDKNEIIAFFTSDMVREALQPVSQAGYKEGYLTKRGKNFGGWKTRYFVLNGPTLEYYESRGGTHLGSITITGAQIGRQQKSAEKQQPDEDNDYRHAFLIIEAKKGPGGSNPRHVLCAQSDQERDDWVEELVRYVTGTYNENDQAVVQSSAASTVSVGGTTLVGRTSTSSTSDLHSTPPRRPPRKEEIAKGPAVPISQLPP